MSYENETFSNTDVDEWTSLLRTSITLRPEWIRILFTILMLFIFVVGVIGNLITCVVIYYDKTMHTATNYYLFNLAVSDLLVAFGILLEVSGFVKNDVFPNGDIVCKMHFLLVVALWNNGVLIMTALAIERYIAILRPLLLNSKPVWRRVMKIIVSVWVVAILETLPEAWTVSIIRTSSFSICVIVPSSFAKWLNGILGLINFVIPLTIMIFVYTTIALKVNMTTRNHTQDKVFNHRDNRSKVNKLIVALTLSFLGCWLPFFVMRIILFSSDLRKWPWYLQNWDLLLMVCSFNGWFSIVLNPMLFSLMSTKFRKALKNLWNKKFKRTPVNHSVKV